MPSLSPAQARIASRAGGVPYYGHVFPVQGPHGLRGAVGEYHAPRSGGRIHEGLDIAAACGTAEIEWSFDQRIGGEMTTRPQQSGEAQGWSHEQGPPGSCRRDPHDPPAAPV